MAKVKTQEKVKVKKNGRAAKRGTSVNKTSDKYKKPYIGQGK